MDSRKLRKARLIEKRMQKTGNFTKVFIKDSKSDFVDNPKLGMKVVFISANGGKISLVLNWDQINSLLTSINNEYENLVSEFKDL